MRLLASIRPPWPVIAHLEAALRPEWTAAVEVGWTYPVHWRVPLADFGDVVKADAPVLCEAVAEEVGRLSAPSLRLGGVNVPTGADDDVIWVRVEGDLPLVATVASSIQRAVRGFGFVLDRRSYKPRIQLGRLGPGPNGEYLTSLVERLGSYEGRAWVADSVTLGHEIPATPARAAGFAVVHQAAFAVASGDDLA